MRDVLANAHVAGHTFQARVADAIMRGDDADRLCNLQMGRPSSGVRHLWIHMRVSALKACTLFYSHEDTHMACPLLAGHMRFVGRIAASDPHKRTPGGDDSRGTQQRPTGMT